MIVTFVIGYDDIDGVVDASVKMDGLHHGGAVAYMDDEDEDQVDMAYYDNEDGEYEAAEMYSQIQDNFERPHVPINRKLISKSKVNRQNNNNNNNTGNANRRSIPVGHSLSLYRQQPLKNLASRKHLIFCFYPYHLLIMCAFSCDCIVSTSNRTNKIVFCVNVINIF